MRRFRPIHIGIHVAIVLTFLTLGATGLPLKFSGQAWARPIESLFGGPAANQLLHRIAGVLTFGYAAVFLAYLLYEALVKRTKGLFWGWESMTPRWKDLQDLWANFKWFCYRGKPPHLDRWAYWEKFDFFAVFWGIPMIGISGLMLWAPMWFTKFLPGWALNVAYVIHSDEALLATGFIFFFHFFHTHLRPGGVSDGPGHVPRRHAAVALPARAARGVCARGRGRHTRQAAHAAAQRAGAPAREHLRRGDPGHRGDPCPPAPRDWNQRPLVEAQ